MPLELRRVLVVGGLGFLGLNLVRELARRRVPVRVVSRSFEPLAVRWLRDLAPPSLVDLVRGDIGEADSARDWARDTDLVVNLAGDSGALRSVEHAREDMFSNVARQLNLLDGLRASGLRPLVIFVSSRLVYGPTGANPVDEDSPTAPTSLYGVHKLTVEHYHRLYHLHHGIPSIILRVTNPYGPYQLPERKHYGIINRFISSAVRGETISLYGGGAQLRDYIHATDVAAAILQSATCAAAVGQTFNVGFGRSAAMRSVVDRVIAAAGAGRVESVAWPPDALRVETGDFVCDVTRIRRVVQWAPRIDLEQGLAETVAFYRSLAG